ncbi:vWA domain-containing protein [Siminovitchia sediminis]|uniref:VWA domain-containing protein n=1 Tax=Siminovitchia sediminis TaxID=1274353 RepID=A0ABW4KBZ1_9BACI
MNRFIDFNDEKTDTPLILELTDLAKTLARSSQYEAEIRVHSYLSQNTKKVYVSHFWNHRLQPIKKAGMKSDIYLRAYGNKTYTDFNIIETYRRKIQSAKISGFARQLLMLAEDIRVEELCKKDRPGMADEFQLRRQVYAEYHESQLMVNLQKSMFTDAFFNAVYLMLHTAGTLFSFPHFYPELDSAIPQLRIRLEGLFDTQSTKDCVEVCTKVIQLADEVFLSDMLNEYLHLPVPGQNIRNELYADLKRKDPLQNDESSEEATRGDEQVQKDMMGTWHREIQRPGKSFLQFELKRGTKTGIDGANGREGEEDQALGIVQGKSGQSEKKEFSRQELIGAPPHKRKNGNKHTFGKANQHARPIFVTPDRPDLQERAEYSRLEKEVRFYHKKLKKLLQRMTEKKQNEQRTHLKMGRLGKNLLSYYTEDQPNIFYKKTMPGKEMDAAFILLVDCSASMFDKMTETKRGVVLFHEALKSVNVPHEIIGFWEDANDTTVDDQPNYFMEAVTFSSSLQSKTGPEIMVMEAMEDNRDGYAIRIAAEKLIRRPEKQKFLIVFSDGEPAAFDYHHHHGILDTHEAVKDVRKKGIEVFNVFLSNSGLEFEQKKVFENIYGNKSIIAPYVEDLPDVLFPLLKRLLRQSLQV